MTPRLLCPQALSRREQRGGDGPEAATPTAQKHKGIDQGLQHMTRSHNSVSIHPVHADGPGRRPHGAGGAGGGGSTRKGLASAHTHLPRRPTSPQRPPSSTAAGVCVCVCVRSLQHQRASGPLAGS